jgi:hypothetical protein
MIYFTLYSVIETDEYYDWIRFSSKLIYVVQKMVPQC